MRNENWMGKKKKTKGSLGIRTDTTVSTFKEKTKLTEGEWKGILVLAAWSVTAVWRERSPLFLLLLAVLLYSSYTDFAEQYVYNLPVALFAGTSFITLLAGKVWENAAAPIFLCFSAGALFLGIFNLWGLGDSFIVICIALWSLTICKDPFVYLLRNLIGLLIAGAGFILAFLITGKKKGPFVPYLTAGFLIETVFFLYS